MEGGTLIPRGRQQAFSGRPRPISTRNGQGQVKRAELPKLRAISPLFMQMILHQLRQAAFVSSQMGDECGQVVARSPRKGVAAFEGSVWMNPLIEKPG